MIDSALPALASTIAQLVQLAVSLAEVHGLTRAEALERLRASEQILAAIDEAEWAELTRRARATRGE